jgi:hypothetical protein
VRVLPHHRRSDSLERLDAALFAALGLVVVIARLDGLLEKHGRPPASRRDRTHATRRHRAPSPGARTPQTTNAEDQGILMALLGLVALSRTCGAHLDALTADGRARRTASAPAEARLTAPAPRPEDSRSLLR